MIRRFKTEEWMRSNENINVTRNLQTTIHEEHTHDFVELEYIYTGSGYQVINGIPHPVEKGDLMIFDFGDRHRIKPEPVLGVVNVIFRPEFFSSILVNSDNALDLLTLSFFREFLLETKGTLPVVRLSSEDFDEIETISDYIKRELEYKNTGYLTVVKGYVSAILAKAFRAYKMLEGTHLCADMDKIAPEVIRYIEENYNRKLSLKELAASSFYNSSYFSRVFKEYMGKNFTEFISEKRIYAAEKLLIETVYSVEKVAEMVGYNDKKQFYKLFKAYAGTTPEKFRIQQSNKSLSSEVFLTGQ